MSQPIGYWVKEVDRLIEECFARLLAEEDLTRRHWQVLNTVAAGPVSQADLDTALTPFRSETEPSTAPIVESLATRGWVRRSGGRVALTDEGAAAHAAVSGKVMASRRRITDGVSESEYATAVGVLERMADNLAR